MFASHFRAGATERPDMTDLPPTADAPSRLGVFLADPGAYRAHSTWGAWPAFGLTVLIIVTSMAAALGALWVYGKSGFAAGGGQGPSIIWMLISQVVMIALTLVAIKLKGDSLVDVLVLGPPRRGLVDYAVSFSVMIGILALLNLILWIVFKHDIFGDLRLFGSMVRNDLWWLALIVVGVGAPLSEELLFRGFLQSSLTRSSLGFGWASLVTTLVWTALHAGYSVIGLIEVLLIGGVFIWMLRRTGSLRVPLVCHAIYNTALGLFLAFGPQSL
jgi:membrane protease YdiL (CAAX protease family)